MFTLQYSAGSSYIFLILLIKFASLLRNKICKLKTKSVRVLKITRVLFLSCVFCYNTAKIDILFVQYLVVL